MQDNARKITYGAMMIALFAILLAVSLYTPLIGSITMFFIPLPIILYRLRYDRTASLFVTATGIVLSLLVGGITLIPFALVHGLLGFVIGETVKTGKSKLYTFMATGITLIVTIMIFYVATVLLFSFNIIDELQRYFMDTQEQVTTLMTSYGGGLPENFEEMMASQMLFYQNAIPSIFIIGVFLLAFIIITLNLMVARRLGHEVAKFPPLREMKLPVFTVVLYGILLLLTLLVKTEPGTTFYLTLINATIILRTLFLLQGISFILYYMHKVKLPNIVAVIAVIFGLALSPMTTMLGILDSGVNIRGWIGKDKK
ncbi:YybS family protein [Sporosarcina sp. HYO08]|uniref:YybS family protein n=1 Tax=Sporosarcina sp. HYO08 TaxID=1759557 RepID=UPI0007927D05|nr:YybS family protein [Sporosarcina sp. HYO08]KXH80595.1 hypothetical protein AU377_07560 [Sporosarcina sp. HYO08]